MRNVSKKDEKRAAALYQALRHGRSSELKGYDREGRSRQRLGINIVSTGPHEADKAASKLDSDLG